MGITTRLDWLPNVLGGGTLLCRLNLSEFLWHRRVEGACIEGASAQEALFFSVQWLGLKHDGIYGDGD